MTKYGIADDRVSTNYAQFGNGLGVCQMRNRAKEGDSAGEREEYRVEARYIADSMYINLW